MEYNNISALDKWWSRLTVAEKERIATKAKRKAIEGTVPDNVLENVYVHYPDCTTWWTSIDEGRKQNIHDHVTDGHGLLLKEYSEGKSFSY